jgi:alpha-amylase
MEAVERLAQEGIVRLSTVEEALREVPGGGLAYLPSASYREMEGWALPTPAALRFRRLADELGEHRMDGPDGALVRGGHWRHFLVKYPEANRMHKRMLALSALCRERGDPAEARRAIGRAQCNDAYWHGVFGGLYLPHLREAVWRNLAEAEGRLRAGEPLAHERRDLDADGREELLVHSAHFSALVAPHRGGGLESLVPFIRGVDLADTLARRREPYHEGRDVPEDADPRAICLERVVAPDLTPATYHTGRYPVLATWARAAMRADVRAEGAELVVELRATGDSLVKRYRFGDAGLERVELEWDPAHWPADALFTTELSVRWPVELACDPAAECWHHRIATLAQSERGLDETVQGEAYTLRWRVALGRAAFTLRYPA